MIITKTGRFFWPFNISDITEEIFSGTMVFMNINGSWKYWEWDLANFEILSVQYDYI